MCGITGYFKSKYLQLPLNALKKATDTLIHRGPDDAGYYENGEVGLGHRRLSIIDLSESGHQPMMSSNGKFIIVFNGEIYNYKEIKKELLNNGYMFRGTSDTEVIANGYQCWGKEILKKLNGIFAIAIWDDQAKKLLLARDRLGVKPLYYYNTDNLFLFGSEIKAILSHQIVKPIINPQGFHEFLYFGYALGYNTLFLGIKKLMPGNWMEVSEQGTTFGIYWKHEDIIGDMNHSINEREAVIKTRKLLEVAVQRQLVGDVPVGIFLSGGIDSSAITAMASRYYGSKLKSYSAGFDFDKGHNELPMAAKVAKKFDTEHQEMMIYGKDIKDAIRTLISHHDEPFSDAANIPLYLMTKEMNKSCKVILQGDGGDELFAGYPRYHIMKRYAIYKTLFSFSKILSPILPNKYIREKTERFYPLFSQREEGRMFARFLTIESDTKNTPESLLSDEMRSRITQTNPFLRYSQLAERFSFLSDNVQKLLWIDTCIILPDQFLEKVDKSTMANGVEVRVPFLDNDITNFALSLPSELKVKKGIKKYILKKALIGILPDEVLYGPKKGFGVPYESWLKGPLKEFMLEILNSPYIIHNNIFNYKELNKRMEEHFSGHADWGFILWKILNLCLWIEMYNVKLDD